MRTTSSRTATKTTHTPSHTSTDSPQVFCLDHYQPQGSQPSPFPNSPPPSPNTSPLIDSIFERAPTEWGSDMKSQEDLEENKLPLTYNSDLDDETPMPAHKGVVATR
ncbi:hypothetical protein CUMW_052860 [Citrus unshiu]|nr:hypothetical protein CUMW_052860 [Citrus unshiu]